MAALPAETERHEPLPLDPLGKRLCLTFPYLWQAIVGVNESDPQWQTVQKYPLRPRVLWRLWQDAAQLVGVRFDHQTTYALLDIDKGSSYHPSQNPQALATIRAALETIGLYRIVLVRSSWSEGLHLYIPLPEIVPTFGFASTLKQCLEAQGLTIAQGQLEVFPNCKSYAIKGSYSEYNAHRLPLQPHSGSYLLDSDGNPVSQELGRFFEQWDIAAAGQDMRELREAIATARLNRKGKPHRQSTVIEEWIQDLRAEMEEGWTGYGQTNHLLKTIACYGVVFEGLTGNALVDFIQQTAIHAPGYFQWCRHQQEIHLKAAVWARAAEGYYWKLGEERKRSDGFPAAADAPAASVNLQRSADAQQRIREAMVFLAQQGTLPELTTARAKAIASQGSVSLKTLYRHPELWHPDHSIAIERWCKTAEPELDIASDLPEVEEGGRSLKFAEDKEFYTLGGDMKGKAAEGGFSPSLSPPVTRRLSTTNFSGLDSLEYLADKESSFPSVIQLSFPQLQLIDEVGREQVESTCTQALARGDRDWVLRRLLKLWQEGHGELVRALCQWHPEWGFEMGEAGLVEVTSNAPER